VTEELISGLHAVLAALTRNPELVEGVWVSAERRDTRVEQVIEAARAARVKLHRVPRAALDRMADSTRHQGVVARLRSLPARNEGDLAAFVKQIKTTPLLLVLDGVQDPHNLGACLRVADAAGAHAVIVPRDRSAPLSAAARRAAAGAAESIPVFEVVNLARSLRELKEAGLWLIGASQDGDTDLYRADLRSPCALVLGGEGKGLRRLTREHCDTLVQIPMVGTVESLNVSVAAGICLFEVVRQRRV